MVHVDIQIFIFLDLFTLSDLTLKDGAGDLSTRTDAEFIFSVTVVNSHWAGYSIDQAPDGKHNFVFKVGINNLSNFTSFMIIITIVVVVIFPLSFSRNQPKPK